MPSYHLAALLVILFVFVEVLSDDEELYSAVVVEYSPYLNSSVDADTNILNNVKNYVNIIKTAATLHHKADIIIFPESSLIGYRNKQKLLTVPDPNEKVNPCIDVGDYEAPLVQLSCAARATGTYIVVNLSEKYYNITQQVTIHFNTNVAFDRNGCVIARYRKIHLYAEGDRRPSPDSELVYFDTDFGVRFGLLTCFDIIFKDPGVELAREYNISHFIFTSAWFSQMPFLTAIQEQYYWSYTLDVCLLAAGYNMPSVGSTGSGIYLGREGPSTYVMAEERGSFMLQSFVPKQCPSSDGVTKVSDLKSSTTKLNLPLKTEELNSFFMNGLDLLRSPNGIKTKQDYLDVFSTELIQPPDSSPPDLNVFNFTIPFIVQKTLCLNTLCCNFSLRIKSEFSKSKEDVRGDDFSQLYYRLAVFDGVKNYDGAATGGLQTCAIIPCITRDPESCGLRSDNKSAITNTYLDYYQTGFIFESIEISGNLSTEDSFIGPNVLVKGQGKSYGELLLPDEFECYGELLLPDEFEFTTSSTCDGKIIFTFKTLSPVIIVSASLYGRLFSRDGKPFTKSITEDPSMSLFNIHLDILLFVVVTLIVKFIL